MTYFVTLDDKKECVGVYCDGELHFDSFPDNLTHTWSKTESLGSINAEDSEFAQLYCQGKSLDDVCPEHLKGRWEKIVKRMKAYHNSFVEAKVSLMDNCFFDLIPQQYLLEFCDIKTQIIKHVFETREKPDNYDLMKDLGNVLLDIQKRKLRLNLPFLKDKFYNKRARELYKDIVNKKKSDQVFFDPFKTKTGRLAVKSGSFPILNLDRDFRNVIMPDNKAIMELDYNAAEIRVLLALAEKEQPKEDIHQWNSDILGVSRDEAKRSVISWLYGSKTSDIGKKLSEIYRRDEVLSNFYDPNTETAKTPFGRQLNTDDFHALNHLVQSTAADMVFEQMVKLREFLEDKDSFIKFCMHDSVVIDLAEGDLDCIEEIIKIFSNTRFGGIKANVSVGRHFGSMKKLKL
jgi:hypothetical protein